MLKYKICVLFILILFMYSFNFVYAKGHQLLLLNKVIYIDAGHGGVDPGTIYKDIYEKDINLSIAQKLEQSLFKEGAIVYMTRYGDYDLASNVNGHRKRSDLSRRSNVINDSDCDIYISIHLNSESTGLWNGAQVFYDDVNNKNEEIAKIMQEQFKIALNSKREYKKIDNVYLNKKTLRPGVLVEVGFLSNSVDRYLLKQNDYQEKIALTIKNGIINYFYK